MNREPVLCPDCTMPLLKTKGTDGRLWWFCSSCEKSWSRNKEETFWDKILKLKRNVCNAIFREEIVIPASALIATALIPAICIWQAAHPDPIEEARKEQQGIYVIFPDKIRWQQNSWQVMENAAYKKGYKLELLRKDVQHCCFVVRGCLNAIHAYDIEPGGYSFADYTVREATAADGEFK